jgi:hypothetical protein
MDTQQHCSECNAVWTDGLTCQDHFHQMGYWEFENPSVIPEVHHLMVLSYHLQHPSLYSPAGLSDAKQLLTDFLIAGITPPAMRKKLGPSMDSGTRNYKIKATAESFGVYAHPVHWTMTTPDVIAQGVDAYVNSVKAWAQSIYDALKTSDNLP